MLYGLFEGLSDYSYVRECNYSCNIDLMMVF